MSPQVELLSRGIDLLVGTPGRLMELVKAEALDLSTVTRVVVDEADRMLDMGFCASGRSPAWPASKSSPDGACNCDDAR